MALADEIVAQNSAASPDTAGGTTGSAEVAAGSAELAADNAAHNAPAVGSIALAPWPVGDKLAAPTNLTTQTK